MFSYWSRELEFIVNKIEKCWLCVGVLVLTCNFNVFRYRISWCGSCSMCDQCQFTEILSFAQHRYFNFAILLFDANRYGTVLNEVHTVGTITYTTCPKHNHIQTKTKRAEKKTQILFYFPFMCDFGWSNFAKEEIGRVRGHLVWLFSRLFHTILVRGHRLDSFVRSSVRWCSMEKHGEAILILLLHISNFNQFESSEATHDKHHTKEYTRTVCLCSAASINSTSTSTNITCNVFNIGTLSNRVSYILRFRNADFKRMRRNVCLSMAHSWPVVSAWIVAALY